MSASGSVKTQTDSALPTIAPSPPSPTRPAIERRSARLLTPPLATTGRVGVHTSRRKQRFGPVGVPSLYASVRTDLLHPSASSRASTSNSSPPSLAQPRADIERSVQRRLLRRLRSRVAFHQPHRGAVGDIDGGHPHKRFRFGDQRDPPTPTNPAATPTEPPPRNMIIRNINDQLCALEAIVLPTREKYKSTLLAAKKPYLALRNHGAEHALIR
jgi:hypothetical protein